MTIPFPQLAQLLEQDEDRVRRVVWAFYCSATKDVYRLDQAAAAHQWQTVRQFARRIHVSCLQVGECDAAQAAAALTTIPDEFFAGAYRQRRPQIMESLERAEQFVGEGLAARSAPKAS